MNTRDKIIGVFTFLVLSTQLSAQQEPLSTFFREGNLTQTNPGMTGAVYKHAANILWRDYWIKKTPLNLPRQTTFWTNYSYKIDKINSGIGINYRYDALGYQKRNTVSLSYAYHIPIKSLFLSIGVSGGINTLNRNYSDLTFASPVPNPDYNPVFTSDFGIALRHEKWNTGISVTQWNNPTFRSGNSTKNYTLDPHFWWFVDYRFKLSEYWDLTPRIQLATDWATLSTTIQLLTSWKKNLWFGVGVKNAFLKNAFSTHSFTVSPMIGYDIKGMFRIGYAGNISNTPDPYMFHLMTHEVIVSFLMK